MRYMWTMAAMKGPWEILSAPLVPGPWAQEHLENGGCLRKEVFEAASEIIMV